MHIAGDSSHSCNVGMTVTNSNRGISYSNRSANVLEELIPSSEVHMRISSTYYTISSRVSSECTVCIGMCV